MFFVVVFFSVKFEFYMGNGYTESKEFELTGADELDGRVNGVLISNGAVIYDPQSDLGYDLDDQDPVVDDGSDFASTQLDAAAAHSEAQLGAGDAGVAHRIAEVLGGHYINLAQITGVLECLAIKGRTDYKIFKFISAVNKSSILDLIKEIGGKNFGDLMLEVFYGENGQEVAEIKEQGGFSEIAKNRAFYVDTNISFRMEQLLPELLHDFMKMIRKDDGSFSPDDYFNPKAALFRRYVVDKLIFMPQILALVDQVYAELTDHDWGDEEKIFNQQSFKLRGSSVSEDWLDTRLAGVSPSGSYDPSVSREIMNNTFLGASRNFMAPDRLAGGDEKLWNFRLSFLLPYVEFLFHKAMSQLKRKEDLTSAERQVLPFVRYDFDEDEQLGIQVAPTIRWENHVVALVDEDGTVHMDVNSNSRDLNSKSFSNQGLLIRVVVDQSDNISVHYAFPLEDESKILNADCHVVGAKLSYLSEQQILAIAKLMRQKQEFFGFPLDAEFCIDNKRVVVDKHPNVFENPVLGGYAIADQQRIIDVQTRVAPDVFDFQHEDQSLDGYTKVAESVFSPGQKFCVKGNLMTLKSLDALGADQRADFQKKVGDLGRYILLLNSPIDANLYGLEALKYIHDNVFAGVIDMSKGMNLTHTWVRSGASNFLRENIPAMGLGSNTDALFDLIPDGETVSEVEVVMLCRDGKTVEVYVPDEVAGDLLRRRV